MLADLPAAADSATAPQGVALDVCPPLATVDMETQVS